MALQAISNRLFYGAVESIKELDEAIRTHAENWRLERMPAVDRNLLRLAIYELTVGMENERTPPAVVINEALEIARRYSGEASIPFINGVLDGMRKSLGSAEAKQPLGAAEEQS